MPTFPPLSDAVVSQPPPTTPPLTALKGGSVRLSPLLPVHIDSLYDRSHGETNRESVWKFLPYGPFTTANDMRKAYDAMSNSANIQFYAVHHEHDDSPAGVISYLNIHPTSYSVEIGHIWHAADKQRGIANSESAFLLIDNAFTLGYRRVEWKCNALNHPSRQAALRLGFSFEGVFRQHFVFKGRNRDSAWFALLDKDWPAVRNNFIRWFDAPESLSLSEMNRPIVAWSLTAHDQWQ